MVEEGNIKHFSKQEIISLTFNRNVTYQFNHYILPKKKNNKIPKAHK